MASKVYLLSESDAESIRRLIDTSKRTIQQSRSRPPETHTDHEEQQSSDVYIARTPDEGIPALNEEAGTGTGSIVDTVGYAECEIYRVLAPTSTTPRLHRVSKHFSQVVYNILTIPIIGGAWILIDKDKFGRWIASFPPSVTTYVQVLDAPWSSDNTPYSVGTYVQYFGSTYRAGEDAGTSTAPVTGSPGVDPNWTLVEEKLRGELYSHDLVLQPEPIWVEDANTVNLYPGWFYMATRASDYLGQGSYITNEAAEVLGPPPVCAGPFVVGVACVNGEIVVTTKYLRNGSTLSDNPC